MGSAAMMLVSAADAGVDEMMWPYGGHRSAARQWRGLFFTRSQTTLSGEADGSTCFFFF